MICQEMPHLSSHQPQALYVGQFDVLALNGFLEPGDALLGVVGAEEADEAHALGTVRQSPCSPPTA